jgi:hypothetical protein
LITLYNLKADDGSIEVPMNDVNFTVKFDCKHEAGHYMKVKFDWV